MSEAVMIELAKQIGRQQAHGLIRKCAMNARKTGKHMKDVLLEDEEVSKHLAQDEIECLMSPDNYIGTAVEQVEQVVKKLRDKT
ncbi:MAG: adenylosuccinate lyase, partial [Methanocellales archaeon]|nr:adenylosuccinate lyase [Methanocellales archaeon]